MSEGIASDILLRRSRLERECAEAIGMLLFAFGTLETTLGMSLVWANGGREIESRTERLTAAPFAERLEELRKIVDGAFPPASEAASEYLGWIERAQELRALRNRIAHGRWGFDGASGHAVNVAGLPTGANQNEVRYCVDDLKAAKFQALSLARELPRIKDRWRF